ncbi:MAG: RNA polymerase sigma factor [Oscillospiraceae bacterium]|nr:RNA polymerase sigma factor [Oscillospiraceae bacterium]
MDNGASSYRRFRDDGDESGLAEIITEYRDGLIFYLNSIVGNITVAEELAEDTFVLLGTKKPKDKGKGSFKTWLYTIGRNIALNDIRRRSRFGQVSVYDCPNLTDEEDNLEKSYIREEQKIIIHQALRKLKPEYRQVLWLIYFEDFSNKEAAAVMKKSVHNIETLVYRARKSLKSQLETEGFIYEKLQ